jgi:hypothetical protein
MPILFIDYHDTVNVGVVIESFRNETGLTMQILEDGLSVHNETTVRYLQKQHLRDMPASFPLRNYRGSCIIDISKSVKDIENFLFERFLLRVRILTADGKPLDPSKSIAKYISKNHPSKYQTETEIITLRHVFFRIYSEVWENIDRITACLDVMEKTRKESDTVILDAKVLYCLSDQKDPQIRGDVYTQSFISTLDNHAFSSVSMNQPDPPNFFFDGLFQVGLTVYDILRLDYRIVLSLEWGSCYKSQQTGLGIRY